MTTLLRPSTRQLARLARLSARATITRPPYGIARGSQQLVGAARAVQFYRFYSSEPPRDPKRDDESGSNKDGHGRKVERRSSGEEGEGGNKDNHPESQKRAGEAEEGKKEGEEEEAYLRPGWVRLTEDELKELERIAARVPQSQKENADIILRDVKKIGAPPELRDLLQKNKSEGLSIADFMRVMRLAWQMADELARYEVERDLKNRNKPSSTTFDSKAPGQEANREQQKQQEEPGKDKDQQQQQQQQQQRDGRKGGSKRDPSKRPTPFSMDTNDMITTAIAAAVLYSLYKMMFPGESSREITWQELRKNFLDKGLVEKLVVIKDRVRVDLNREATQSLYPDSMAANPWFHYYFTIGSIDAFERRLEEAQSELGIPSTERIPVSYATESALSNLLLAFGPTLLFFGLIYWFSRRSGGGMGGNSGLFGYTKSKAKMFNHETAVKVKFADVAGADEAKVEIMEFVSFLKQPERFQRLGAKIPRGAILSGPPGTGKTLLAKATAGESGVPFFSVSGSEFIEVFVGVGASRVRDLFATARRNAPCIIFIDEIDAVGKSRANNMRMGNDERESTLNQILTEMDGFNTSEQVVVLAGTNRPDTLDAALMRPGRFDRHIHIDRPTAKGRQDIFRVHLQKILTKENMDFLTGRLAALTPGFAGADIANAVNEAALIAARANAQSVEMIHFEQAIERVVGGLERKSLVLSPEEKRTVAYHEAGHAICGWFFEFADPLLKVSIIPRGQGALGYAQYVPAGDAYLMSTKQLMDRMAMTLGGRVSEELHFPTVTTGASDDFKKVTRMASNMVTQWGMSEKLGPLHFQNDPQNQVQKPFAESTAQTIDAEVRRIVDEAYKQCKDLLTAKKKEIGIIAEELLRKEMLDRDDLIRLLGPRPFPDREEFSKFFDGTRGKGPTPTATPPPSPPPASPPPESADPPPSGPQPALFEGRREDDVR